jgi:riboflavin kinase / FMN adenylyltransferase
MQVIREVENYKKSVLPVYLALGNFDGIHLGHQRLLSDCVSKAHANNGISAAFIFDPHPSHFLSPDQVPRILTDVPSKSILLEQLGIDMLILNTFTPEISHWSPREFIENILVKSLSVREVFVGFNYSFGHKGLGTPEMLKELGSEYGFAVNIIPPVIVNGNVVSSTLIRRAFIAGDVKAVQNLLGYNDLIKIS